MKHRWDAPVRSMPELIQPQYLIRNVGSKNSAHVWLGTDTACRMWSTGGMKQSRFSVTECNKGRDICQMCTNALKHPSVKA